MFVVPVCMEGFYASGMTCLLCDRGSFNNQLNQTTCDSCPGNQTTMATGSTSQDHCGTLLNFYNKSRLGFYHLVGDRLFQGGVAHHRLKTFKLIGLKVHAKSSTEMRSLVSKRSFLFQFAVRDSTPVE